MKDAQAALPARAPRRCRWGFHQWSTWFEAELTHITVHGTNHYLGQKRSCLGCKKEKTRG